MFGKVIVFGLFEIIKKKVRTVSPGPGSASMSGRVRRHRPSHGGYLNKEFLGNYGIVRFYPNGLHLTCHNTMM